MKGKVSAQALIVCAMIVVLAAIAVAPAAAGQFIGGVIPVSYDSCWFPDAVYDSVDQKFLVLWSDYSYSPSQVRGQFITNDGALSGGQFQISSSGNTGLYPAGAYNSTNNEILVTWIGNGDVLYGRRVRGSDGALLGSEFQVSSGVASLHQLAWNAATNTYLSVMYAATGTVDIRGQRINSAGALLGGEFLITNDSNYSAYPDVNGGSGSEFMVCWDDEDGGGAVNIRARRVDASSGALLGSQINVTSGTGKNRPHIAYDNVNSRYMIVWNDWSIGGHSYDQAGQIISSTGSLVGGVIWIASTAVLEGDPAEGGDITFAPSLIY